VGAPRGDRAAPDSDTSDAGTGPIDSFLVRHIRLNPGLRFGAIVQSARVACRVSQATVARHLSRLVRIGELAVRPDRTYSFGEPAAATARAVLEVRRHDEAVIIDSCGTARGIAQDEFRVISGKLTHLYFIFPKPTRQFILWCSVVSRVSRPPR